MNCNDCQVWLHQYLDGKAPEEPIGLREHRRICLECRSWHAAAQQLLWALAEPRVEPVPAELPERIVQSLFAQRRRDLVRRRLLTTASLAAALLLVVIGWRVLQPDPARPGPAAKPLAPVAGNAVSLRDNVAESGSLIALLGRRTIDQTVEQGKPLVPAVLPPALAELNLDATFDPPGATLREAGQSFAVGLEPVTNSARRALALFERELGPAHSSEATIP